MTLGLLSSIRRVCVKGPLATFTFLAKHLFFITLVIGILEVTLRTTSIVAKYVNDSSIKTSPLPQDAIRILVLGESTTSAMIAGGYNRAWPGILQHLLQEKTQRPVEVINRGIPGSESSNLLAEARHFASEQHIDIIISMMGINDRNSLQLKSEGTIQHFIFHSKVYRLAAALLQGKTLHRSKDFYSCRLNAPDFIPARHIIKKILKNEVADPVAAVLNLYRRPREETQVAILYSTGRVFLDGFPAYDVKFRSAPKIALKFFAAAEKLRPNCLQTVLFYSKATLIVGDFRACQKKIIAIDSSGVKLNQTLLSLLASCRDPSGGVTNKEIERVLDRYQFLAGNESAIEITKSNYQNLARLSREIKATYIAMQYPLVSIHLLRSFFSNQGPVLDQNFSQTLRNLPQPHAAEMLMEFKDVVFVSNEENFTELLKSNLPGEVFTDYFAGDFGHMTYLGHLTIAENLLQTLELKRPDLFQSQIQ